MFLTSQNKMGQAISKIFGSAIREVKMYDIERRAEKVISSEKPKPAPMHLSTLKELKRLKDENVSTEYLHKKDEQLDKYLKKVYVTTPDKPPPTKRMISPEKPLPQNRMTDREPSYGYSDKEVEVVPEGRVSLKQALEFINDYQTDPQNHSSEVIADKYRLPLSTTNDILEHFQMFNLRINRKPLNPKDLTAYQRIHLKMKSINMANVKEVMEEVKKLSKKATDNENTNKSIDKDDITVDLSKDSSSSKKDTKEKG